MHTASTLSLPSPFLTPSPSLFLPLSSSPVRLSCSPNLTRSHSLSLSLSLSPLSCFSVSRSPSLSLSPFSSLSPLPSFLTRSCSSSLCPLLLFVSLALPPSPPLSLSPSLSLPPSSFSVSRSPSLCLSHGAFLSDTKLFNNNSLREVCFLIT